MQSVLFVTNYPSPYRVQFFDELGKYLDVTVLFSDRIEKKKHRSADWFVQGEGRFRVVQLTRRAAAFHGRELCLDVTEWLAKPYDTIVICGYSSPTAMLAIAWLRHKKIPFYLEVDGGLVREDSGLKYRFKKSLVGAASFWLSTGRYPTQYLVHYGAREDRVYTYPFSSLYERDIRQSAPSPGEKAALRQKLDIRERYVVLSIGQFIPRKGFDILLRAAAQLLPDTGIYIVGGEPTEEYLALCRELGLNNVHFCGFQKKDALALYYQAADLFALPTREDIWGLVVNEAMAYGLPVVTTDKCVAGLELVENGVNGFIVPADDPGALAEKLNAVLAGDAAKMGAASLEKIRPYTIENMAKAHVEIFENRS